MTRVSIRIACLSVTHNRQTVQISRDQCQKSVTFRAIGMELMNHYRMANKLASLIQLSHSLSLAHVNISNYRASDLVRPFLSVHSNENENENEERKNNNMVMIVVHMLCFRSLNRFFSFLLIHSFLHNSYEIHFSYPSFIGVTVCFVVLCLRVAQFHSSIRMSFHTPRHLTDIYIVQNAKLQCKNLAFAKCKRIYNTQHNTRKKDTW